MKRIITIGREFGSGGREVGRRLAERLNIAYYDREIIDELMKLIDTKGLATLLNCKYVNTNLAVVRKQEIMAAINRYRNH